jgi:hypothetical protein
MHETSMKQAASLSLLAICFTLVSCVVYSSTMDMEATDSSKTPVDFQQAIQKIELFIIIAVGTSYPI